MQARDILNAGIVLTYSPSTIEVDRICGHTFEVLDYFLLLYDCGIQSTILIQDRTKKEIIFNAWEDKYDLPEDYQDFVVFSSSTKIITKGILVFTDGFYENYLDNRTLIYKKLFLMRCSRTFDYNTIQKKNVFLLQDERVYSKKDYDGIQNINYIKKIYFKRYRKLQEPTQDKTLVYVTSNLRKIPDNIIEDDYLIITGDKQDTKGYLKSPVPNLFQKFSTYLYTETTVQFDCSSRLLAECIFYNKKIKYNFNFQDYCSSDSGDTGLYFRHLDVHYNFQSINLDKDDAIIKILEKD